MSKESAPRKCKRDAEKPVSEVADLVIFSRMAKGAKPDLGSFRPSIQIR
jgi:hypothetical protein